MIARDNEDFPRDRSLARIPQSGDRETQCTFVDPPIVGIYHVDRTCLLLTRTHTSLIRVSKARLNVRAGFAAAATF